MKIAIIVLNYNGLENTIDCLNSLKKIETDDHIVEITVVDNNSQDGSQDALSKLKDIHLIPNSQNLGYSGGNNTGISDALKRKADLILILNNDTIVDKEILIHLVKKTKSADIISPKIYFNPGFEFHKERYQKSELGRVIWYAGGKIDWENIIGNHIGVDEIDRGQFNKSAEVDFATGAAMFVERGVFEKIGLFDEKYFLYLEDMDFCVRAKKAGFKIMYEPKAIIWHKNAQSVQGSGSSLQDYFITRNRLLFAFKFAKLRTKVAVLRQNLVHFNNPTKRKALLDLISFRLGAGTYF